jgi:hypothetical protein
VSNADPRNRFELTIRHGGENIKHICVSRDDAGAIKKLARSYGTPEPEVVRVVRLGVLPKSRANGRKPE